MVTVSTLLTPSQIARLCNLIIDNGNGAGGFDTFRSYGVFAMGGSGRLEGKDIGIDLSLSIPELNKPESMMLCGSDWELHFRFMRSRIVGWVGIDKQSGLIVRIHLHGSTDRFAADCTMLKLLGVL